jgi:hypothetical protein
MCEKGKKVVDNIHIPIQRKTKEPNLILSTPKLGILF